MVDRPLKHKGKCPPRKGSPCDSQFSNVDDSFVFTIYRMEMGWPMVPPIHLNDDSEENTDRRHQVLRKATNSSLAGAAAWAIWAHT